MAAAVSIEGAERIPEKPTLILPNRMTLAAMDALQKALGGADKVAWLVDSSLPPNAEIMTYLRATHADGIQFSSVRSERSVVRAQISTKLAKRKHVIFLPGHPEQVPACLADVLPEQLNFLLEENSSPVLPIYIAMLRHDGDDFILTSDDAHSELTLRFLSPILPGSASPQALSTLWGETCIEIIHQLSSSHPSTLAQTLLHNLIVHPSSRIIDGVDEQVMTYRRLLTLAAPIARHLHRHIRSRRIGIILPPGHLSIIANTACLLAGITPVNFDFSYTPTTFTSAAKLADVTLHISSRPFIEKQDHFAWPPSRDLILIDDLLALRGLSFRRITDWFAGRMSGRCISAWINTPAQNDREEALCVFSSAQEGSKPCFVCHSHRAVLTGWRMVRSRFLPERSDASLSTLPFHHRAGLLLGLIFPLLSGQDIITYPESHSGKRIVELALQFKPALSVLAPDQVPSLLSAVRDGEWLSSCYTIVAGRLPSSTAKRAVSECGINLCECYFPIHATMPVACSIPGDDFVNPNREAARNRIPSGELGSSGLLMPGLMLHLSSLHSFSSPPPKNSPGLIWLKRPTISASSSADSLSSDHPAKSPAPMQWICTDDLGHSRPNGLIDVDGRKDRFSLIGGELISHEYVENTLNRILHVDPSDPTPRIAVIGLPSKNERDSDSLILLSTLHKVVGPHDAITIRYAMANAHISANNAPQQILALRAIPTLPGGHIDYNFCRYLATQILKSRHR